MIKVQKSHNEGERRYHSQRDRIGAAAETYVEHRAKEKCPEARRKRDGGQPRDRCLGHMAIAEQLRNGKGNHSAIEAIGEVG